ncbi:MAG: FAD-dependent oxidoreductase [Planctomycetes bacterium]|nr:FAD-dependent oxidoreductase [Planctomycetota bacterium]
MTEPADAIPIDVLVVGGGIQGLWVLRQLEATKEEEKRSALLVQRPRAGEVQSLHNQGFIYQGYFYARQSRVAKAMLEVSEAWSVLFQDLEISPVPNALLVTRDDRFLARWRRLGLSTNLPRQVLESGDVAWKTPEGVVPDLGELRKGLWARYAEKVRVGEVGSLADWSPGDLVRIQAASEEVFHVRPESIVLAAGRENDALLESAGREPADDLGDWAVFGVALRPLKEAAIPKSRLWIQEGLGIARPPSDPKVWVSSIQVKASEGWRAGARVQMRGLLSRRVEQEQGLRLSDYEYLPYCSDCWPALDRGGPGYQLVSRDALHAIWPTRLTLAPAAALRVVEALPPAKHPDQQSFPGSPKPPPSQEYWRTSWADRWESYADFYGL